MRDNSPGSVYSAREIALAAGVPEAEVRAALVEFGIADEHAGHDEALRIGRTLIARRTAALPASKPLLFSRIAGAEGHAPASRVPLAVSSALHFGLGAAALLITTFGLAPAAATIQDTQRPEPMRLVFLASPGPGGGGGGGGLRQIAAPPKALREGHRAISSPLPKRDPPRAVKAAPAPPEPKPAPLDAEPLPAIVAPIVESPADSRTRPGAVEQASTAADSHGSGTGGGIGRGAGTGIGEGSGPGVGAGSGGGTGGGPYRPGSGIDPPRLLREVKADYTEDARRRNLEGEVLLEIVVRRDGGVGDVKVIEGLGAGLNERAVQAVRQWRFAPAHRLGAPVDVIVEVSVEFALR